MTRTIDRTEQRALDAREHTGRIGILLTDIRGMEHDPQYIPRVSGLNYSDAWVLLAQEAERLARAARYVATHPV
jgi:hypothetical protein